MNVETNNVVVSLSTKSLNIEFIMLSVLINAYACSPNMGSEPGMAWNWCVSLANYCELYVITEGEFRDKIESVLPTLPQAKNIHFYYNPVSEEIRRMCWNQGDWRFYKHYRIWQYHTYEMALDIMKVHHIDIVHQLNMIGFREPGYLWKIEKVPFVWGPIGGLKQFPLAYLEGVGLRMKLFNGLKNIINVLQLKYDRRVNAAFRRADVLVSSIPDSFRAIKMYKKVESVIIPETGCFPLSYVSTKRFDEDSFHVLWVGKFDFRKQLFLALKAIAATKNKRILLDVYGTGTAEQVSMAKALAVSLGIAEQVVWHGNKSNYEVHENMRSSQIFLFTSVSEDTSTVVLEAVSNQLPVVCFDTCGMAAVINEAIGRKVALSNPAESVVDFARILNELEADRELLKQLSLNCRQRQEELSWDNKAKQMVELYKSCSISSYNF